jgi:hypothetical protein
MKQDGSKWWKWPGIALGITHTSSCHLRGKGGVQKQQVHPSAEDVGRSLLPPFPSCLALSAQLAKQLVPSWAGRCNPSLMKGYRKEEKLTQQTLSSHANGGKLGCGRSSVIDRAWLACARSWAPSPALQNQTRRATSPLLALAQVLVEAAMPAADSATLWLPMG